MRAEAMPPWDTIDTVLLDMDGTLLDLYFDWHFWCEHMPAVYAEKHGTSAEEALQRFRQQLSQVEGTLQWYCVDYWSQKLDLPLARMKREISHLIKPHPGVDTFLSRLRQLNKRLALVTNAHRDSLTLKLEVTAIGSHFDAIFCTHDYGWPKEDVRLWRALQQDFPYDPNTTLLIDDNLQALHSARSSGIRHLLLASHVSPHMPPVESDAFPSFTRFEQITPPPPALT